MHSDIAYKANPHVLSIVYRVESSQERISKQPEASLCAQLLLESDHAHLLVTGVHSFIKKVVAWPHIEPESAALDRQLRKASVVFPCAVAVVSLQRIHNRDAAVLSHDVVQKHVVFARWDVVDRRA